jgi:uncharacterized membrane protein YczE
LVIVHKAMITSDFKSTRLGKGKNMQHFLSPWTLVVIAVAALVSWRWEMLVIVLGVELCSQSLHESRHHPDGWFANYIFRLIGIVIAGAGAWFLK